MQVNHNMRSLRLLQDIGQKELAAKMHTSQNNISRLERGKIKMTEEKKKSAAEALGVSEEVLDHFHEKHIFISQGQKGGSVSQAGTVQNALPEESLEGFRAAIQSLQDENRHLRVDLA
jgi:transcriptional regulator with XRE-family HTH domain